MVGDVLLPLASSHCTSTYLTVSDLLSTLIFDACTSLTLITLHAPHSVRATDLEPHARPDQQAHLEVG